MRFPADRAPFVRLLGLFATLLLAAGCTTAPNAETSATPVVDPVSDPVWVEDMARFAAEDAGLPPPARPVVFTGSSSVRLWTTLATDFPDVPVLNRGFGGSHVRDAVWYVDEIAVRYRPRKILLYAGDNDLWAGRTPQQVLSDVQAFVARVHRDLPGTPIAFIAIKPSPSRVHLLATQREANALVQAFAERTPQVEYIDVFTPMLDAQGRPREDLFVADRLHLNAAGYALWRGIIAPHLR